MTHMSEKSYWSMKDMCLHIGGNNTLEGNTFFIRTMFQILYNKCIWLSEVTL